MLYRAIKLWNDDKGRAWIAYQGHNPGDLAMGPASTTGTKFGDDLACNKSIEWAKSQRLEIIDRRA